MGRAFAFPAKYSDVADMGLWAAGLSGYSESVDPKNYVIAEDDMETFFSNGATGYSGSMTIDNNTYEEAKASDCDVMGLFLDNCPEFSIGGIKAGSTIEDVNKTFGVNYTNECRTLTVHSDNGAFTDSKGKSVPPKEAAERLDRMAQELGELIDQEETLLRNIMESDKKR